MKKLFKYLSYFVIALFFIGFILGLIDDGKSKTGPGQKSVTVQESLSSELLSLIGTQYIPPVSSNIINNYGMPETLSGTTNTRWVAYFKKGNFTMISNKQTKQITKILQGKKPQ
jgi:hypothetical protein